jgi:hypothetical protein
MGHTAVDQAHGTFDLGADIEKLLHKNVSMLKVEIRCFPRKASMSMAKQKAPNARRAIVEQ